jgi:hypothetical protein
MLQPHVPYVVREHEIKRFVILVILDLNSIITNMIIIKYLYDC